MLWFLLLIPECNTGDVSTLALKFYILWNVRISLLLLILLLTCFKHIPFYRFPLHLYVQIHIIVVRWDWNVLELLKILSLCGSWLLRPNRAKFEHNPVCGSTNAPLVFTKEKQKRICSISLPLVMFMVFGHYFDMLLFGFLTIWLLSHTYTSHSDGKDWVP